ncbi:MAG: VOC family protein [Pseudomonadota bacterium]
MIDHVSIGVRDLANAGEFYEIVLSKLGHRKLIEKPGTIGFGKKYPEFWLNHRPNRGKEPDNGMHICIRCGSAEAVTQFHETALAAGALDAGEPGFRPQYSPGYFAAFIWDVDGNKIEAVTFVT